MSSFVLQAQENNEFIYHHYKGSIGKDLAITANLCFSNVKDVNGYYSYDKYGIPISLYGTIDDQKKIVLHEISWDNDNIAEITATMSADGAIHGKFKNLKTNKSYELSLSMATEEGSMPFYGIHFDQKKLLIDNPDAPYCSVNYDLLMPGNSLKSSIADSVTKYIDSVYFGYTGISDPSEALRQRADSAFKNYMELNADTTGYGDMSFMLTWMFDEGMNIIFNSEYLLSMEFTASQYTGGAHGMYGSLFCNIDLKTGKQIKLNDVIKDPESSGLKKIITDAVRKEYAIKEGDSLIEGGFFTELFDPSSNFYLTKKGIGFFYNPYEVACYAIGTVDIFIPFSELNPYLNEDFTKMISQ